LFFFITRNFSPKKAAACRQRKMRALREAVLGEPIEINVVGG
jgi:hypothetical protein